MSFNQRGEKCKVKNEEDRTKNGALLDTKGNVRRSLTQATDSHSLRPTSEIRIKPPKNDASNAVKKLMTVEEHMVVDSIESRSK